MLKTNIETNFVFWDTLILHVGLAYLLQVRKYENGRFSGRKTVVSAAETVVSAAETIVSAAETVVSAAESVVSAAETAVSESETAVSDSERVRKRTGTKNSVRATLRRDVGVSSHPTSGSL